MSKIVNSQLVSHLETNKTIKPCQYGFRIASNTQSALFDLVTSIQIARDKGKAVAVIFLDKKKAFDTVHREILLQEMNSIGIVGDAHEWFQDYLKDRKQYIEMESYKSDD